MNKRKQLKILKSYLTHFCANPGETKKNAIQNAVCVKKRYLTSFIDWVYNKYGEGNINENRFILEK
jgi:hypothetical protein